MSVPLPVVAPMMPMLLSEAAVTTWARKALATVLLLSTARAALACLRAFGKDD